MTTKETLDSPVLRRLGVTVAVFLAIIGWIFLLADLFGAFIFSISAVVILITALIKPSLLKRGEKTLIAFADIVRHIIPKLILILLFYLVLTPYGIIRGFYGKSRSSKDDAGKDLKSYWLGRKATSNEHEHLEKQY